MTDRFPLFLLALAMAMASSCAESHSLAGKNSSAEMRRIIASLRENEYDLDVSGLPKARDQDREWVMKNKKLEICRIPHGSMADVFYFTVYDKARGLFWVSRSGGYAGVSEFYGPVKAPPARIVP